MIHLIFRMKKRDPRYHMEKQEAADEAAGSRPPSSRWAKWLKCCAPVIVAVRKAHSETEWRGRVDCPVCSSKDALRVELGATGKMGLLCSTSGCVDSPHVELQQST